MLLETSEIEKAIIETIQVAGNMELVMLAQTVAARTSTPVLIISDKVWRMIADGVLRLDCDTFDVSEAKNVQVTEA